MVIADMLAGRLGIPFADCVKRTREIPELKNVSEYDERIRLLAGIHNVDAVVVKGKRVLLFDDLFRSGATMNAITIETMKKVFIGGSRRISRLNAEVRQRLDNIIAKRFPIVIGDANGADRAVQQYLLSKGYADVEVFCVGGYCRNNLGNWPSRKVAAETSERNFQFMRPRIGPWP
jgi:hypothetical protein